VTLKSRLGCDLEIKVIGNGTTRKLGYGLLFTFDSNYRRVRVQNYYRKLQPYA